jgi:tetratricopeptide (TPR) repeat protein
VAALTSLAVIARNAGHLKEAGEAIASAHAIAPQVRMRAADRAQLERNMAVIDHDLGRYAAARDRLRELIAATPAASERALQLRILANVYADMGAGANALAAAEEAMSLLPAEGQAQRLPFVLQARARGLAASGRVPEAIVQIEGVLASLAQIGRAPESFEVLRARRYRAEFLGMAGRAPEALSELRELRVEHSRAHVSSTEQGLALDALGEAEARAGNVQAARAAHEAARASLAEELPDGHPYLMRNAALTSSAASSLNRVVRQ